LCYWVAQVAIERAEAGDFALTQRVLALLERPFDDFLDEELTVTVESCSGAITARLDQPPPAQFSKLRVTCSS